MPVRKAVKKKMTDAQALVELGLVIRRIRLEDNMSQAELASRAGLYRSIIQRLESGQTTTLLTLMRVLRAMDRMELLAPFNQKLQVVTTVLAGRRGPRFKMKRERASAKRPKARKATRKKSRRSARVDKKK